MSKQNTDAEGWLKITFFALVLGIIIMVFLLVAVLVFSAMDGHKESCSEPQTVKQLSSSCVNYVEFDGHQYIEYHVYNRGSLCHSPKCPCQVKQERTEE